MTFDQSYWQDRWVTAKTGWDIGYASPPLRSYIDQMQSTAVQILIPGCGNAYEAKYLYDHGFDQTEVIDISPAAIHNAKARLGQQASDKIIEGDFFDHIGQYDRIFEQTFFCALDRTLRKDYVEHMHRLLKPDGKLVGVLFGKALFEDHPPFGGDATEYRSLFEPYFDIEVLEACHNSIQQRAGSELFIIFRKKDFNR